jgi:hypothetical protein
MSWSPCAELGNGGAIPASCLSGPFLVSRFCRVPYCPLRPWPFKFRVYSSVRAGGPSATLNSCSARGRYRLTADRGPPWSKRSKSRGEASGPARPLAAGFRHSGPLGPAPMSCRKYWEHEIHTRRTIAQKLGTKTQRPAPHPRSVAVER